MRKKSSKKSKVVSVGKSNLKSNLAELFDASVPFVIAGVVTGASEMVDVEEIVKVSVLAKRIQAIPIPVTVCDKNEIMDNEFLMSGMWGKMFGSVLHGSVRGLS